MSEYAKIIRVFVSSPGDVEAERAVLDDVVASINRIDGQRDGFRIELFRWEDDVVPQIGPEPQEVVDGQTRVYHIYLGIMSARYGGGGTIKEFRDALANWQEAKTPWIAFYFNDAPHLSSEPDEVRQYLQVCEFRKALQSQGIVCGYRGVDGKKPAFFGQVSDHLRMIVGRLIPRGTNPPPRYDPTKYLETLRETTASIDIRGLAVGKGRASRFPIEDLFISLTTTGTATRGESKSKRGKRDDSDERMLAEQRDVPLDKALVNDWLVVVGDPGAGKTTFLRRIAFALCQTQLGEDVRAAETRLGIADRTFPVFVRISELAQQLRKHENDSKAPKGDATAAWLPHFLGATSKENSWGLDADFFRQQLEAGQCMVLLDGLDEAPDRLLRERVSRLIESVTKAYKGCRFVVTSRPAAYTGDVVLPDFAHARIDPLADEAVETFLRRWCEAIYADSQRAADEHCNELLGAVRARAEIRRMARNPVMLTALAVLHWNERRLPEQRADLYGSIITWLSRSREQRPDRVSADRTVVLLQELALAMQDDPEGRKTQVSQRWAAEKLAGEFGGGQVTKESIAAAETFLAEEEVDSGIIVGRGHDVAFWHLTFQEYLAAKAIASRREDEQFDIIFNPPDKPYQSSWREVIALLAGALHQQGKAKVDGFIAALLKKLGDTPTLAEQARCAGLIGIILRDLEPVKYHVGDPCYPQLLDAVMAIFDPQQALSVEIQDRVEAADALSQVGDPRIDRQRDDYWVEIPAGKFLMGAQSNNKRKANFDEDAYDNESPVHEVYLDAYHIARYPVTVGEFQRFIDDDGYLEDRWWSAGGFKEFSQPDDWDEQSEFPSRPVVGVSWWEAAAFAAWAGCRLLAEAEWERAARGTDARKYPWGPEPPDASRTNFDGTGLGQPSPVGVFPLDRTPDGVCDMGGNVWEWCADWYGDYDAGPAVNPSGPSKASSRVIRGGCWYDDARSCRGAYRWYEAVFRYGYLGFRSAAVPPSQAKSKTSQVSEAEPGA